MDTNPQVKKILQYFDQEGLNNFEAMAIAEEILLQLYGFAGYDYDRALKDFQIVLSSKYNSRRHKQIRFWSNSFLDHYTVYLNDLED